MLYFECEHIYIIIVYSSKLKKKFRINNILFQKTFLHLDADLKSKLEEIISMYLKNCVIIKSNKMMINYQQFYS